MPATSGSAFTRIHGTSAQDRRAKIERREQGGPSRFRATKRIPRARIWKARSRATGEFKRVSSAGDRTLLTNGRVGANQSAGRSRCAWREYPNRAECEPITAVFA